MIVKNELEKEVEGKRHILLYQHLPVWTEENHEKPQSQ